MPIWLSVTICVVFGVLWLVSTIGLKILQRKRLKGADRGVRRDDGKRDDDLTDS